MTNEKILQKAIKKAVKNGWDSTIQESCWKHEECIGELFPGNSYFGIVFSHDFAKAFYPKGWTCYKEGKWQDCEESQQFMSETLFVYSKNIWHLMESMKEEEPLRYIEKFL